MPFRNNLVALSLSVCLVHASVHHQLHDFSKRSSTTGGLALNASPDSSGALACPAGSSIYDSAYCCPDGTNFNYDSNYNLVCCPTEANCAAEVLACPRCADPSWVYWNDSDNLKFCCEANTYPNQQDTCVSDQSQKIPGVSIYSQCAPGATAAATGPTASATSTASPTGSSVSGTAAGNPTATGAGAGSTPTNSGAIPSFPDPAHGGFGLAWLAALAVPALLMVTL